MNKTTNYRGWNHKTTCKLLSGEITEYDLCDSSDEENEGFELIGEGIIWEVDGVNQGFSLEKERHLQYFFKRK
jgi:hypothetical protein